MNRKVVGTEPVLQLRPDASGPLVVTRQVTGPGGMDSCEVTIHVSNYPSPAAAVVGPNNCVVGGSISLVDRSTGEIETGEWQINGKSMGHDVSLQVKPDRPGPLVVVRRVTGPGGMDSCEFTVQVSNYAAPTAGFLVSNLQPIAGDSVTVRDSASGVIENTRYELLFILRKKSIRQRRRSVYWRRRLRTTNAHSLSMRLSNRQDISLFARRSSAPVVGTWQSS